MTAGSVAGAGLADEFARVHALNRAMTESGGGTLGDLARLELATVAGKLSAPMGWWSCPWCWMDYVRPVYAAGTQAA